MSRHLEIRRITVELGSPTATEVELTIHPASQTASVRGFFPSGEVRGDAEKCSLESLLDLLNAARASAAAPSSETETR